VAKQPFLTIVTRCRQRPKMLTINLQQTARQTDRDIEQIFLPDLSTGDHPGGNVLWANRELANCGDRVDGRYAYTKDDDAVLVSKHFVEEVKRCAEANDWPHVILVKSICAGSKLSNHFLPDPKVWRVNWEAGKRPEKWIGHGANVVVRADYWKAKIAAYKGIERGGDWHYITDLIAGIPGKNIRFVRLDIVASLSLQRGRGVNFEDGCPADWWAQIAQRWRIQNYGTPEKPDWRLRWYER